MSALKDTTNGRITSAILLGVVLGFVALLLSAITL